MSNFLSYACAFTGSSYDRVIKSSPGSKRKIVTLASSLFVPTLLWFITGFALAYSILDMGFFPACIIAVLLATIIFFIERMIIASNGNGFLRLFRFVLAIATAYIGAMIVDLQVFKNDIDNMMPAMQTEYADSARKKAENIFEQSAGMNELKAEKIVRDSIANQKQQDVTDEMNGEGSGLKGNAGIARGKQKIANTAKADAEKADTAYNDKIKMRFAYGDTAFNTAYASFNPKSILYRKKALERLKNENSEVLVLYWIFTLVLFCFEIMVLVLKWGWDKTDYDMEEEMLKELRTRQQGNYLGGSRNYGHKDVSGKLNHVQANSAISRY